MKRWLAVLALGAAMALGGPAGPKAAAGQPLPAGHPPVEGDPDEDEPVVPPAPKGHGAAGADPRFFTPPEDTAVDDPSLPPGVVVVTVKDAQNNPVPGAPVTLGALHSSVARGDSRQRFTKDADGNGAARFDGLTIGSGSTYRASTTRGPATYAHPPVGLGDKAGKQIVVHAYDASAKLEELAVALQGLVYLSLREDSIQIEQLVTVYNLGPVAWTPDLGIDLPAGFKAFNKQDSMDEARVEEVSGTGAALRGTFAPGRHDLDFRYQVPLTSDARQTLKIKLPPRVAQARVMAEASKTMGLEVKGFPVPQRTEGRDGKHLLVTEHQASRADGGVSSLEITLTGLPTPGPGRWVAVALAVLTLGAGVAYAANKGDGAVDEDTRGDLREAREALLDEIVALERAFKGGEVGPKAYARIRMSLLDALARIVAMLDAATPVSPKTRSPRSKAEPA